MIDTLFVGIRWLLQRLGHTITAVFEPDAVGITKMLVPVAVLEAELGWALDYL